MIVGTWHRTIDDPKVITQLESLAMQTVEAQVGMARNTATAQANKLSAEGWAMAEIAKASGDASVMQARIDAENQSKLSKVRAFMAVWRPRNYSFVVVYRFLFPNWRGFVVVNFVIIVVGFVVFLCFCCCVCCVCCIRACK